MRVAAAGYVSGEFGGTYDSVKVDRLRRAADAGEPIAVAQLAYCITTGRGGLTRNDWKVFDYLRRSAEAGYLWAQYMLGRWFYLRYMNPDDPSEGIRWYERAYQRGNLLFALVDLACIHTICARLLQAVKRERPKPHFARVPVPRLGGRAHESPSELAEMALAHWKQKGRADCLAKPRYGNIDQPALSSSLQA